MTSPWINSRLLFNWGYTLGLGIVIKTYVPSLDPFNDMSIRSNLGILFFGRLACILLVLKHYRGTRWDGLSQNVTNAAISLGWDENVWSEPQGEPASYGRKWSELSEEEKIAAHALCHFDVTWPGDGTSINLLNRPDESANDASQIFAHMSLLPAVLGIVTAALYVQT
jgi:hypothetical protein